MRGCVAPTRAKCLAIGYISTYKNVLFHISFSQGFADAVKATTLGIAPDCMILSMVYGPETHRYDENIILKVVMAVTTLFGASSPEYIVLF